MIPVKWGTNEVSSIVAQLPALRVSRLGHGDRKLQHPEFLGSMETEEPWFTGQGSGGESLLDLQRGPRTQ